MPLPQHVYKAAQFGDLETLRAYFASGDRDPNGVYEPNGWTLLDGACMGRQEVGTSERRLISCETISFLLEQGASVDYLDPGGTTHRPLAIAGHICGKNGTNGTAPLELLIEAGASVHPRDSSPSRNSPWFTHRQARTSTRRPGTASCQAAPLSLKPSPIII